MRDLERYAVRVQRGGPLQVLHEMQAKDVSSAPPAAEEPVAISNGHGALVISLFSGSDIDEPSAALRSVQLEKHVLRQIHDEEDEKTPNWIRYLAQNKAPITASEHPDRAGSSCPTTAQPSCNPFAAAPEPRGGAVRRQNTRAGRQRAQAPYSPTATVITSGTSGSILSDRPVRQRINVDETALLLSFMK